MRSITVLTDVAPGRRKACPFPASPVHHFGGLRTSPRWQAKTSVQLKAPPLRNPTLFKGLFSRIFAAAKGSRVPFTLTMAYGIVLMDYPTIENPPTSLKAASDAQRQVMLNFLLPPYQEEKKR